MGHQSYKQLKVSPKGMQTEIKLKYIQVSYLADEVSLAL